MYYWLYLKFYAYFKTKKGTDSTFDAACLICFAQVVHAGLLLIILVKTGLFDFPKFPGSNSGKFAYMPFLAAWLIAVYFYYKRKIKRNQSELPEPLLGYQLVILYAVAVFLPLYIAIKLRGDSLW